MPQSLKSPPNPQPVGQLLLQQAEVAPQSLVEVTPQLLVQLVELGLRPQPVGQAGGVQAEAVHGFCLHVPHELVQYNHYRNQNCFDIHSTWL